MSVCGGGGGGQKVLLPRNFSNIMSIVMKLGRNIT